MFLQSTVIRFILPLINTVTLRDPAPSALWAGHCPKSAWEAALAGTRLFQIAFPEKNQAELWVHPEGGLEKGSDVGEVPTWELGPVLR